MTVGELIDKINIFISSDKKRNWKHMYAFSDTTINNVYYREGYVILQSNEIDYRKYSLNIKYVLHCLKFFKPEREVIIMVSDEDEDYEFYKPLRCVITYDEEENFLLLCNEYDDYGNEI